MISFFPAVCGELEHRPAQDVDPLRVVLERSQFGSEDLQGLQHFPVLQILQILLLQQQELHPLSRKNVTERHFQTKPSKHLTTVHIRPCLVPNPAPCLSPHCQIKKRAKKKEFQIDVHVWVSEMHILEFSFISHQQHGTSRPSVFEQDNSFKAQS